MTTIQYRVPYADTDQMGVVYYANYLVYFERARNELLRECGMTYRGMEQDQCAMLPVSQAHVDYRAPAVYDDLLDLSAWVSLAKGARLRIDCRVERNGESLATGYTVHACVDRNTRRPIRLPALIAEQVES